MKSYGKYGALSDLFIFGCCRFTLNIIDSLLAVFPLNLSKSKQHIIYTIVLQFLYVIFSGNPVQVDINMYVRSMGPISEMDMVSA